MRKIVVRQLPLAALVLALSACGGGGGGGDVASTPPPVSTPPAPPPTGVNQSLTGTLQSETFANDAARGSGSFVDGSPPVVSAGRTSLNFVYNAATGGYTLTENGRTLTFAASDLKQQDATARYYEKTSGTQSDALTLTKPGTSGRLTYQYVGSGFWEQLNETATRDDARVVAFTYGAATPGTAVPTTGSAAFAVDLLGTTGNYGLGGAGSLSVDFASGLFSTSIATDMIALDTGQIFGPKLTFGGTGKLGANASLNGSFGMDSFEQFSGTLDGRFYGPAAQEVGLAFSGQGRDASVIAGTVMGRRSGQGATTNLTTTNLVANQSWSLQGLFGGWYSRSLTNGAFLGQGGATTLVGGLSYNAADKSWSWTSPTEQPLLFADGQKSVTPDGRFLAYDRGDGYRLLVYRPGTNSELQLSYASFAKLERVTDQPSFDSRVTGWNYQLWGVRTDVVPTSGSASYSGALNGIGSSDKAVYSIWGDATFNVNFASNIMSGTLTPIGRNLAGGAADLVFAPTSFSGTVDRTMTHWQGSLIQNGAWTGEMRGNFFGPQAAELAGYFSGLRGVDPNVSSNPIVMQGVVVAKKN